MKDFLRWLAELRGIPVEPGADLQLELSSFPSGGLGLLTLIGVLLAMFLVVYCYRRDGRNLTAGKRFFLASLRVLAVLAAVLVVLEPNLVTIKKDVRDGHSIILIDLSQSMGHRDAFRREEVRVLAESWTSMGQTDLSGKTRLELAKALLSHSDYALIDKLNAKNKVLIYGFSAGCDPVPLVAVEPKLDPTGKPIEPEPGTRVAPRPKLEALAADGKYSNLGGAIRSALQKSRDTTIAAVIVLSDGRRNIGAKGAEISRLLAQRRVDHTLVLGIGDPSETQSVGVARIEAPERAFQKDPFKISATVVSQGYDSLQLAVRLVQVADGGGGGAVVQTKAVELSAAKPEATVEFENILVAEAGIRTYRVEVEPPRGEPINPERHSKQARVQILAEKTKVLLIASAPLHEYQILRQLLTRDSTIELACWLESADQQFMQDGNVNLKKLPDDRKDLEKFDVFILMDPDPNLLDREFCQMVAREVEENGAGLWWIAGEKYSADAMEASANTAPIADLLPVVANMPLARLVGGMGRGFGYAYPFELTPQGRDHPAMRLLDSDRDTNAIMWSQMPGWHFTFPVLRGKPAARVLAVTNASHGFREGTEPMPVIATHFFGAGRVMFSGTDETYRWRSRFEEQYNRFWVKSIRYLFEGRLTAGSSRLRIETSGEKLELGEPLKIVVEAKDDTYQPLSAPSYTLQLTREKEVPENLELRPIA
ncbi:MAG: hypothetical protein KDC87_16860, partial [Planctomycetes bacterium]|nr:hypothetical protein [Planctomycetota bacterium]